MPDRSGAMIRVLLIDSHVLVRDGLRRLLEDRAEFAVVGAVADGREAVALLKRHAADVALVAVNVPEIDVVEGMLRLRRQFPPLGLILVTEHVNFAVPRGWARRVVAGFLSKEAPVDEVAAAIREVAAGRRYIGGDLARRWALAHLEGDAAAVFRELSQREFQVLLLVAQGKSVGEISHRLCLSPKTIHTYRQRLRGKLGVHSEVEMVRLAHHHGMIADA